MKKLTNFAIEFNNLGQRFLDDDVMEYHSAVIELIDKYELEDEDAIELHELSVIHDEETFQFCFEEILS